MRHAAKYIFCISSLLAGCTTAQYQAIEKQEKETINHTVAFKAKLPEYRLTLDKNDHVLCVFNIYGEPTYCDGFSDDKNEFIEISQDSIGLGGYPYSEVRCGAGLISIGGVDKYSYDERACNSRFYKSDWFTGYRIFGGLLTYGFLPLFSWTVHLRSFDETPFRETAYNAHIHEYQTLLYSGSNKQYGSISVVRLASNFDDAYQSVLKNPTNSDSVIFIDDETQRPIYLLRFSDYAGKDLPIAVNQQISDFLNTLSAKSIAMPEAEARLVDMKSLIPPEIALPALPPIPQITKSEYETNDEFNERVKQAVSDREDSIRQLQQQYNSDVNNRNQYIVALGESWQNYLDGKAAEQSEIYRRFNKHQNELTRLFYIMNIGGFAASDMSYDAESHSMYFTATSKRFNFRQKMLARVPVEKAKSIKDKHQYTLTPKLVMQDGAIQMKGLLLRATQSGDEFDTQYTDINYMPEQVSVRVATNDLKFDKEPSAVLRSYVQKPQSLADTHPKEVWYIDAVKRINAKMPEWFSKPMQSNKVLGYGVGVSHDEAMLNARNNLAATIKTSINSSIEILQKNNTFRSYHDVTQHTKATSNVELTAGDVSVLHQAEMDGKFYIELCYRCNVN